MLWGGACCRGGRCSARLEVTSQFGCLAGDHLAQLGFLRQGNSQMDVSYVLGPVVDVLDEVSARGWLRC